MGFAMSRIPDIVEKQRRFFRSNATLDVSMRLRVLKALRRAVHEHRDTLIDALGRDMGKPTFEAFTGDLGLALNEIGHAIRHVRRWARPRRLPTPLASHYARSYCLARPYGVCLIEAPWNFPVQYVLSPLVGAVAAGNCAVVKPSEFSPHTSAALASMLRACFDEAHVAVVEGDAEVAKQLTKQDFDYIFFCGSSVVGKEVLRTAAETLTPVTLELGGKSPCIVDRHVNVDVAARRIVWGKFYVAGQACVAPDYLVAHHNIKDELVGALRRSVRSFYGANPKESPDFARIINSKHFERLRGLLDGANIIEGGDTDEGERYIAPTIVDPVSWDDPLMKEEIFGPILPVLTYDDLDAVVAEIIRRPLPLALYFFSSNRRLCRKVVATVPYGGGCINDTVMQVIGPHLPFGGVGMSGMGRYHGKASFDAFSYQKSILDKPFFLDIPIRYPPIGAWKRNTGWRLFG